MTAKELKDKLFYRKANAFASLNADEVCAFGEDYKAFLDDSKTERDAVRTAVKLAREHGYKEYVWGETLKKGDKKYIINRKKNFFAFKIGDKDSIVKIVASHIDSPRLDVKQNPLYEDGEIAYFKTHYYGGIKKYQWTTIPLALHGVVVRKDGEEIDVNVGEDAGDPVFYITDLLPHLSREQNEKTLAKGIEAENLNVVVGGIPFDDSDESNLIKLNVLKALSDKYGFIEEDFLSAELCLVPAYKAQDVGFDRASIAGYGHDDKVCSYPALRALFDQKSNDTVVVILADKEEIGSEGNTGMQNALFADLLTELAVYYGVSSAQLRAKAQCLSADVTAAFDPTFAQAFEKNNASLYSCGVTMNKFTGAGGKSGSSDAAAEFVGKLRAKFAADGVVWQAGELGRTDLGGGGTVAKYIAKLNIDTVDMGVPVLSMHAPYELISKADLYTCYQAFKAFLK